LTDVGGISFANDCRTILDVLATTRHRDLVQTFAGAVRDSGHPEVSLPVRVRMTGIGKRFGAVTANSDIDFDLAPGEIHALLGENGAGKSTLMSILFGLLAPDSGDITLGDEVVRITSPANALRHGIGMVHQQFMLVPTLTVAENVAIGSRPS